MSTTKPYRLYCSIGLRSAAKMLLQSAILASATCAAAEVQIPLEIWKINAGGWSADAR